MTPAYARTVLPIVTPEEMKAIDEAAPEPVEVLIERAGAALALAAVRLLGGTYGRRVVVIAGPGNNGADGRAAARRLARRGAHVSVVEAAAVDGGVVGPCDLVIDAAYGTGFRGEWQAPDVGDALVLAADIPTGVDGTTGAAGKGVLPAHHTVTFAAVKPGLLFPPGSDLAGELEVADIGLDTSRVHSHLVQRGDVAHWWRPRAREWHKWKDAVMVVAGSPGMAGAGHLAALGALRSGAGMVRLASPAGVTLVGGPTEVVRTTLPPQDWSESVLATLDRFHALVIGPGLGRADVTAAEVRRTVAGCPTPVVVDGDGLFALAWNAGDASGLLREREAPTILTPHDGEYALLTGHRPAADRIAAARMLSARTQAIVLLKGAATVVAEPGGRARVVTVGDERLATAGTGDVLAGITGALLARGLDAFDAAAAAAWIHGRAARKGFVHGLVASDLPDFVPEVLETLA